VQRLVSLAVPTALCLSLTVSLAVIPAAAETPFFSARGKQPCEALQAWYVEFLSISKPGIEKMRMGPELQALIARAFRDDIFQRHFGKTFGELSDSDKKKVQSELEDCFSDNSFVTYFVTPPFEYREKWQQTSAHKEWMAAIEAVRSAPPPPPPAPSALPPEPGERTLFILLGPGKKILSTPTYRAYLLGCHAARRQPAPAGAEGADPGSRPGSTVPGQAAPVGLHQLLLRVRRVCHLHPGRLSARQGGSRYPAARRARDAQQRL
jgi:hypothetical protein